MTPTEQAKLMIPILKRAQEDAEKAFGEHRIGALWAKGNTPDDVDKWLEKSATLQRRIGHAREAWMALERWIATEGGDQ